MKRPHDMDIRVVGCHSDSGLFEHLPKSYRAVSRRHRRQTGLPNARGHLLRGRRKRGPQPVAAVVGGGEEFAAARAASDETGRSPSPAAEASARAVVTPMRSPVKLPGPTPTAMASS